MSTVWSNLHGHIEDVLSTVPGMQPSPVPFDVDMLPETLSGRAFCIDVQTANTELERGRSHIIADHAVTVRLLFTLQTTGGWARTVKTAMDDELAIVDALLTQPNFAEYDVRYLGSARQPTASREHLVVTLAFRFRHALQVVS